MHGTMTEPKKLPASPKKSKPKSSKKPRGLAIMIRLDDPATAAEFSAYLAAQDVEPSHSAVVLKALREFLVSRGFRKPDAK